MAAGRHPSVQCALKFVVGAVNGEAQRVHREAGLLGREDGGDVGDGIVHDRARRPHLGPDDGAIEGERSLIAAADGRAPLVAAREAGADLVEGDRRELRTSASPAGSTSTKRAPMPPAPWSLSNGGRLVLVVVL
jgi:hypothetical protein